MNRPDCLVLILISITILICIYMLYYRCSKCNDNEKFNTVEDNNNNNKYDNEQEIQKKIKTFNCPPFTMIDPIEFGNFLLKNNILNQQEYNQTNTLFLPKLPDNDISRQKIDSYMSFKNDNKTEEVVGYLINLLPYFPFVLWDKIFFGIIYKPEIIDLIMNIFKPKCKKMNGRHAVGVVFVESSISNGPKFSSYTRRKLLSSFNKAINTLKDHHPNGNLNWVTDVQYTKVQVRNGPSRGLTERIRNFYEHDSYWRTPGLLQIRFNNKSFTTEDDYLEELRIKLSCDSSSLYFITPFNTAYPAYTNVGKKMVIISSNHDYADWGLDEVWKVMMHECCHLFGSSDEYVNSSGGTSCFSCTATNGCNKAPNGNCQLCVDRQVSKKCIMINNEANFCVYTQAQIGWIDTYLKVRIVTSRDRWSGTDNSIKITFYRGRSNNKVTYDLDSTGYNDFEMGDDDLYILPVYNSSDPIIDFRKFTISIIPRTLEPVFNVNFVDDFKIHKVQIYKNEDLIIDLTPDVWLTLENKSWRSF